MRTSRAASGRRPRRKRSANQSASRARAPARHAVSPPSAVPPPAGGHSPVGQSSLHTADAKARANEATRQTATDSLAAYFNEASHGPFHAEVERGDAGDHPGVQRFLQAVFPEMTPRQFAASLEEPLYEPSDRIVARAQGRVVGHAMVSRRDAFVGETLLPVARLSQVMILPELRGLGLGPRLLHAAEEKMAQDRVPLGMLATLRPAFFEQQGWLPVAAVRKWQITIRNLLGTLEACSGGSSRSRSADKWLVRPWRQMEYASLGDLYQNIAAGTSGGYERTEAFWRWVVGSCNPARLLVAASASQPKGSEMAGYVVLRDESILDIAARDDRPDVLRALLQRACVEAIERSLHRLEFEAATDHPVHEILNRQPPEASNSAVTWTIMAKTIDHRQLAAAMTDAIDKRIKQSGMARPSELGLQFHGAPPCRYVFNPRSVKLANAGLGRSYLRCSPEQFTRMALGRGRNGERFRFRASTDRAKSIAEAVFPNLPARFCPLEY